MELVGIMPEDLTKGIAGIPLGFSNGGIYQDPTPLTKKMTYGPDTVHDDPDPTSDAFSDPDTYEQANPVALGIMSALTGGALGALSLPSLGLKGLSLYNTVSNFFGGKDPEPQYTGPVNPLTHEIDEIDLTEQQAGFAVGPFGQTQVSLAPAQGAESELGNPPAPTVDPFGGVGAPPSGSGGAGDGTGEDAASAAADSPAGSPWNTGGFVDTGFQMGGIASLLTGANALRDYASSKLNLSNGIGGYGPVLGSFG